MKRSGPKKAVILAAGLGRRIRPLSDDLPKPVMPLWGTPLIGHTLNLLREWGVKEVAVNLHHNPSPLVGYLRAAGGSGLRVHASFEPDILGTGGALERLAWFIGGDPVWVVNGDIAFDVSPRPFLREFRARDASAVLWLNAERGPRTVRCDQGKVRSFHAACAGERGTFTFCGVQLVSPRVLEMIPAGGQYSVVRAYEREIKRGGEIRGVTVRNSYWADLGTVDTYLGAHGEVLKAYREGKPGGRLFDPCQLKRAGFLKKRGVALRGFVATGEDVKVHGKAKIENCVLWDSAEISAGAVLRRAVVGRNAKVSSRAGGAVVRCDRTKPGAAVKKVLKRIGWTCARTLIVPVGARGSDRVFTRLKRGKESVIMVRYGRERRENVLYAGHARYLGKKGLNVPEVLADMRRENICVVEDLGDACLQEEYASMSSARRERTYRAVLEQLLRLHTISRGVIRKDRVELEPPFSASLYEWERELFASFFLKGLAGMSSKSIGPGLKDLEQLAATLLRAPGVLVHRDMQSSNVFLRGKSVYFTDFQGMRLGAAAYDLASLLCDPYVMLPARDQEKFLRYYAGRCPDGGHITAFFWHFAVQRLAQALGAFGRLSAEEGLKEYEKYIFPALKMMKRALGHIEGFPHIKELVAGLAHCGLRR
ncbi:MAG: sugar phosphate nucleotidyltransferase [Kiritimatiellia bacterium]